MVHLIRPVAPYDLAKAWEFLANTEGVAPSAQKRTLIRAWMLRGAPVAVRLEDIGTMNAPMLEAELLAGDEADWPIIEATLRRSLSLDIDLAPLEAAAHDDTPFTALLEKTRGYRMVGLPTPFEASVWAVLKQNAFTSLARANWRKLQDTFGTMLLVDGREVPCFPDATVFMQKAVRSTLRRLKLRKKHIEYLLNAAEIFAHELSDDENAGMSPNEVRSLLATVPGFGPWSVQYIGMRGYGFHDGATIIAPSVRMKARRLYGRPLTERQVRAITDGYVPYDGYWLHLVRAFGPVERKAVIAKRVPRRKPAGVAK